MATPAPDRAPGLADTYLVPGQALETRSHLALVPEPIDYELEESNFHEDDTGQLRFVNIKREYLPGDSSPAPSSRLEFAEQALDGFEDPKSPHYNSLGGIAMTKTTKLQVAFMQHQQMLEAGQTRAFEI